MGLQVVVVGAGIVGAAISHQVAKTGAKVRVLDVVHEPGLGGATRSSWAWINANKKYPDHYRNLNLAGLRRWKAEWPDLVRPCGSLLLDDGDAACPMDPVYPSERLSPARVRELEPAITDAAAARGAQLFAQEAWVDPQAACAAMLRAAEAAGAEVMLGPGHRVERLLLQREEGEPQEGRAPAGGVVSRVKGVLTADGRSHSADVVVLAAGTAVQPLAAQAGVRVPLLHKPAVVAITRPLPDRRRLLHRLLHSARVFAFQRPDGSFMLGDTCVHEDGSVAWGESLLRRATELLPGLRGAEVERVEVAYRPWPQDGHPVVGPTAACRGLYIATAHSGVTLAPELARLVANELRHWDVRAGCASGDASELVATAATLEPYRPGRDFEAGAGRVVYGWMGQGERPAAGSEVPVRARA